MKIKKAKAGAPSKEEVLPPPASEPSVEPVVFEQPVVEETKESEPVTSEVEVVEPPKEELPPTKEVVVVEVETPSQPTGPDPWEFVKCRANKTVLVRGMPQYKDDEFMHYRGQAEESAARGDLEII